MKAVFFDVDGTLIEGTHPDYRYMRENVQKAIRKLQEQGHYVFIASGRSLAFLDEKIRNFGFDGYVLLNGSVIFFHDKIIYVKIKLNHDNVHLLWKKSHLFVMNMICNTVYKEIFILM